MTAPRAHPCGLRLYGATGDEDRLIALWHAQMEQDGDLEGLFTANSRTLAALFRIIGAGNKSLVYDLDERGIWFAMWGEPMLNAAVIGVWIRRDRRPTRDALRRILDGFGWYLTPFPCLLVITKQKSLLDTLERLGYAMFGPVEEWFDGEPGWIGKLTRAKHLEVSIQYRRRWVWPELAAITSHHTNGVA